MLYRDNLVLWNIEDLRSLKTELHWVLKEKENQDKVVLFGIEGYTGVEHYFIDFENALKYVLENTEKAYRDGLKEYLESGRPSYIDFKGFGLRITTILVLPDDIESHYPMDLEEKL